MLRRKRPQGVLHHKGFFLAAVPNTAHMCTLVIYRYK